MSHRILATHIAGIDALIHNPYDVLNNAKDGVVAILINNVPIFYAVSPKRLAQLLKIENNIFYSTNNIRSNNQFFEKKQSNIPTAVPIGKFAMYSSWQPDANFQHLATLWGILLKYPVTTEELISFISYWRAEGKMFHHIQWQQKLARIIQIKRENNNQFKNNINIFSEPDGKVPQGFRGI